MDRPPLRVIYYRDGENRIDFQDAGIEEESSSVSPDF